MPISYQKILPVDLILADIKDLQEWHAHILREKFFTVSSGAYQPPPAGVPSWCKSVKDRHPVDAAQVDKLERAYQDMDKAARNLFMDTGSPVPQSLFDAFEISMDNYINQIGRMHEGLTSQTDAIDSVTGLRTVSGLYADLKREQDRASRSDKSFSLGFVRIDDLEALQMRFDLKLQREIFAAVARVLSEALRSFDDAYYLGKGEYVLVLKHLEFLDACAAMDRLRITVDKAVIRLSNNEEISCTASFGVIESLPDENFEDLIKNARAAADQAQAAGGNKVVEFVEQSPLERIVKDLGKN